MQPNNPITPDSPPPEQPFERPVPEPQPISQNAPPNQPPQPASNTPPAQPYSQDPNSNGQPAYQQPLAPPTAILPSNNIGIMVLQWLTYAFWGWTVLALSILTTTIVASLIDKAETGGFTPYGIASVLVFI